jgi:hypothetical protein
MLDNETYTFRWNGVEPLTIKLRRIGGTVTIEAGGGLYSFNKFKKKITLGMAEWESFTAMVQVCGYFSMPENEEHYGLDGSAWELEYRSPKKRYSVYRWSPAETHPFRKCCEYLCSLSAVTIPDTGW